jgi:hypothetical protein
MRRWLITVLAAAILFAACGDDDGSSSSATSSPVSTSTTAASTTTGAPTTTLAGTTTAPEAPTTTLPATTTQPAPTGPAEVAITAISLEAEVWVQLTNIGGEDASLAGHWLCHRPSYFGLPDITLGPGESVLITAVDGSGIGDAGTREGVVQVIPVGGSLGVLTNGDAEIAFYDSGSFGDSTSILDYVQWGRDRHGRESVAVAAGIWPEGAFVDVTGVTLLEAPAGASDPSGWTGS